jgi:hypothetical protein
MMYKLYFDDFIMVGGCEVYDGTRWGKKGQN